MAGVRLGTEVTYTSGTGQQQYRFTVIADINGVISVRDIRSPFGLIMDTMTRVPQPVVADINTAIEQLESLLSLTSSINGEITFTGTTEYTVTFSTALPNTSYRVHLTPSSFVPVRAINKLTTGFTIQVGVTFTGTVGFDVFV